MAESQTKPTPVSKTTDVCAPALAVDPHTPEMRARLNALHKSIGQAMVDGLNKATTAKDPPQVP